MRSNGLTISKHTVSKNSNSKCPCRWRLNCQPNTYVLDVDSNLEKWDNDEADEFTLTVFTL